MFTARLGSQRCGGCCTPDPERARRPSTARAGRCRHRCVTHHPGPTDDHPSDTWGRHVARHMREAPLVAQIALLLLFERGLGEIMHRLGQPSVIGPPFGRPGPWANGVRRALAWCSAPQPILFLFTLGYGFGPIFIRVGHGDYLEFVARGTVAVITPAASASGIVRTVTRNCGRAGHAIAPLATLLECAARMRAPVIRGQGFQVAVRGISPRAVVGRGVKQCLPRGREFTR